ncbi:hypothetical protein C1752_00474 [Acaryochloris thomasi RCC1774]|uniref:Uncharacterized protein n=2 Tax=Acaryochloris TaxID=155977 RepID=A0A2W1JPU5_9CYAN|nr:hypothetical protein C1752_00474 [Acaryochloris thomasi RCC1774]
MLISTFELLLKSQLPEPPKGVPIDPKLEKLGRKIIQGYFLTLANTNSFKIELEVIFTLKLPKGLGIEKFITFVDPVGNSKDMAGRIAPIQNEKDRYKTDKLSLASGDTILLILQPDFIKDMDLLTKANFEARGYAELRLASDNTPTGRADVLVSAEHRGTFFRSLEDGKDLDIGQLSYGLAVQNSGLLTLKTQ